VEFREGKMEKGAEMRDKNGEEGKKGYAE